MPRVEIRERVRVVQDPVVRDYAGVGVAHDVLAEHFDAVLDVHFDDEGLVAEERVWGVGGCVVVGVDGFAEDVETLCDWV